MDNFLGVDKKISGRVVVQTKTHDNSGSNFQKEQQKDKNNHSWMQFSQTITTRLFSRCMQTSTSKNVALCTIDNQGNL